MIKNIWFTSDWHLNHFNIIKYCNRPFNSIDEMNNVIINNYINFIKENDLVFFVGDIFFLIKDEKEFIKEIFNSLPGKKYLIRGNHDKQISDCFFEQCGFEFITKKFIDEKFIVVHDSKNISKRELKSNKIIIYGHSHNSNPQMYLENNPNWNKAFTYDCGVDANNFNPINLRAIKKFVYNGNH